MSQQPLINIATKAARKAGSIIMRAIQQGNYKITSKGLNDVVTEIDVQAEKAIIEIIHQAYPDHGIWAEESGISHDNNEVIWIIDPLDGTANFVHGFPHFAVSIALQVKGQLEHGVIYDPVRQELFTASRGRGAQCNHQRIRVSSQRELNGAFLGTGFPYHAFEYLPTYMQQFEQLLKQAQGIRRAGSAALDLAYVAAGRLDAYWEHGLQAWDLAAGALLVREAGGLITDFNGDTQFLKTGHIVAGNPKLLPAILKVIAATHLLV